MAALTTNAMIALLTTISHWPLVTIGLSTGVSGDASAGTCNMRRTRFCHDVLPSDCGFSVNELESETIAFSDVADRGQLTDGGRKVDAGEIGPVMDPRMSGGGSGLPMPTPTPSEPVTVDVESPAPPRKYIATLLGPHFCCRRPTAVRHQAGVPSRFAGAAEADGRRVVSVSKAK